MKYINVYYEGKFLYYLPSYERKVVSICRKKNGGLNGEESVVFGNSVKEKTRSTKDTEVKCSVKRLKKKV